MLTLLIHLPPLVCHSQIIESSLQKSVFANSASWITVRLVRSQATLLLGFVFKTSCNASGAKIISKVVPQYNSLAEPPR
jgi:hypothetical protein